MLTMSGISNKIRTFHSVALGDSHKAKNIPCQDAAGSMEDLENGIFIGAVSDGHGSRQYFRSDRGASILVNITIEAIRDFINKQDSALFDVPFTAIQARTSELSQRISRKTTRQDQAFRHLFSSIIAKWNDAINEDWANNTPTAEDLIKLEVPEDYITLFLEGNGVETAYGCTLIAFARSGERWFAFQLGDGKCIAFDDAANGWEPIPWDEKCIGNTTTSICESSAIDNFRYCYGNNRTPQALFIGSDGMDGAYGVMEEFSVPMLIGLYGNIIRSFAKNGFDSTIAEIHEMLPRLSERGVTRDDVSLAGWIDLDAAPKLMQIFLKRDIEETENKLRDIEESLDKNQHQCLQLESGLKQIQESFKEITIEKQMSNDELNKASEAYSKAKETLSKAEREHEKIRLEAEKNENQIRETREELDSKQKELVKEKETREALLNKLESLKKELNNLNPQEGLPPDAGSEKIDADTETQLEQE